MLLVSGYYVCGVCMSVHTYIYIYTIEAHSHKQGMFSRHPLYLVTAHIIRFSW